MSQAVISNNQSIKVNRAISGATTVNANCYAIVNYQKTAVTIGATVSGFEYSAGLSDITTRYFGPGQTIPASFNSSITAYSGSANLVVAYAIMGGVEFINSP